jgi:hypothetical protein
MHIDLSDKVTAVLTQALGLRALPTAEGACAAASRASQKAPSRPGSPLHPKVFRIMADPLEAPAWPSYQIGPHESVFALGVASVNYAKLEYALGGVFANVIGLTVEIASALLPKLGIDARVTLVREALIGRDWPDDRKDRITHFLDAFKVLEENRNLLAHSNLTIGAKDQIALYKYNRAGKTILAQVTPTELRQVADDMDTYFNYGMSVTNMIGLEFLGLKTITGEIYPWPDKPPLPRKLDYKSRP